MRFASEVEKSEQVCPSGPNPKKPSLMGMESEKSWLRCWAKSVADSSRGRSGLMP